MELKQLQEKILVAILYSGLSFNDKVFIFNYLFYQLCWDFNLSDYLELKID